MISLGGVGRGPVPYSPGVLHPHYSISSAGNLREVPPYQWKNSRFAVYVLSDPETDEVRYVGKTEYGLKMRLAGHLRKSKLQISNHRTAWIKSILARGLKPVIEPLEEFESPDGVYEAEQFWVEQFRALGFRLVNATDGGPGSTGRIMSEETRRKISIGRIGIAAPNKGIPHTEETKRKISIAKTGWHMPQATKDKISAAGTGRVVSEETRLKLSASLTGRVAHNKGVPCSEEVKRKISVSHMGIKNSEETKRKIRETKARKRAEELARAQ